MAFDLVAKLKLQDEFSDKLKKVFGQLDKLKGQVKQAAKGTEDMGKKFSGSGTVAVKALSGIDKGTNKVKSAMSKMSSSAKGSFSAIKSGASQLPNKFKGITSKIKNSLNNGIRGPAMSARSAIVGIGSAVGAIAIVNKAFNMLKGSIEGAIARYDTLNAFPKVMEKIGFSTDESTKSIKRLAEGIDGLPTTLGEVADTAQRIAVMTKDLDGATETTLALNNAFLASGADAEKASRGTEQYIKMIATGKVGMDSWTTLQETMGLALNDLAEAFGYTGKSAQNDLYKALKDGNVTFDQFNDKLVELSKKTGGFAETALDGSGGIATAWKNIKTAVTNGVAGSITSIDKALGGTGEIENIIKKIKPVISDTFKVANEKIGEFAKKMKTLYEDNKQHIPLFIEIATAVGVFATALTVIGTIAGVIAGVGAVIGLIASPVSLVAIALAALAAVFVMVYRKSERFRDLLYTIKEVFMSLWYDTGEVGDLLEMFGMNSDSAKKIETVLNGIAQGIRNTIDFVIKLKDGFIKLWDDIAAAGGLSEYIKGIFNSMVESVKGFFVSMGEDIVRIWESTKEKFFGSIASVKGFISDAFETAMQSMKDKVQEGIDFVVWMFTDMPFVLMEKLGFLVGVVQEYMMQLPGRISNALDQAKMWAMVKLAELAVSFLNYFKQAKDNSVEQVSQLPGRISGFLTNTKDRAVEKLKSVAISFKEWFATAKNDALSSIKEIPGAIAGYLAEIPGKVAGVISTVYTKFRELGAAIPRAIAEGFNSAKESLGKAVSWAIDKVVGGAGNLKDLGVRAASSFGSGYVQGRTSGGNQEAGEGRYNGIKYVPRDGYQIRAHRGERVLTAKENKEYNKGGGGRAIAINMYGTVIREEADVDRLAEKMVRKFIAAGEGGA